MVANKRTSAALAVLVFAVSALASRAASSLEGSRSIQLSESAVLSGVELTPGPYTLSWTRETGTEDVRIEIARGRKVLATGKGLWIQSAQPSPYEALVFHAERGANALSEIRFKQSANSIRIDAGATRVDAGLPKGGATN